MVHFMVPYEAGSVLAKGYRNTELVIAEEINTTQRPAKVVLKPSKQQLLADGMDAVLIQIALVDERGLVVPDEDVMLEFLVEGGAEIIGVGNGNPNSHEPEVAAFRETFHGLAQLILKNTGRKDCKVTVMAETVEGQKINEASLVIPVVKAHRHLNVSVVKDEVISQGLMYHALFSEKPQPNLHFDANDQNSMEPFTINGWRQQLFEHHPGEYGLYRFRMDFGDKPQEKKLVNELMRGAVSLYLGSRLIYERLEDSEDMVVIALDKQLTGVREVNVIIQNINGMDAGIYQPFRIVRNEAE